MVNTVFYDTDVVKMLILLGILAGRCEVAFKRTGVTQGSKYGVSADEASAINQALWEHELLKATKPSDLKHCVKQQDLLRTVTNMTDKSLKEA